MGVSGGSAGGLTIRGVGGTPTIYADILEFDTAAVTLTEPVSDVARAVVTGGATLGANSFTNKQTIDPPDNTEAIVITGYSLTGANAQPALSIVGTWNTTGSPRALVVNITNTASGSASLLADLQLDAVSQFQVSKSGVVRLLDGSVGAPILTFASHQAATGLYATGFADTIYYASGSVAKIALSSSQIRMGSNVQVAWYSGSTSASASVGDAGLAVSAPAIVKVTDGSSGIGSLIASAIGDTASGFRLRSSLATPTGLANGDIWVEVVGTSPSRVAAIKVQDAGTVRTIASITF